MIIENKIIKNIILYININLTLLRFMSSKSETYQLYIRKYIEH